MTRLVVVLGDQLSTALSSLRHARVGKDRVVMAEVREEACYVPHHPKKIIFLFSAMRHFAETLRRQGWQVDYYPYEAGYGSLLEAVQHSLQQTMASEILLTECGEYRLQEAFREQWPAILNVPVQILEDDRFICSSVEFRHWAKGRRQLRMEYFYRDMRRKTGLLMIGNEPQDGRWNFDSDNRARYQGNPPCPTALRFTPDATTREVIALVKAEFKHHFGDPEPFALAVTREQALLALAHFINQSLPWFGDYQDAMANDHDSLFHSLLSPYLNAGLLLPLEVCQAAETAWQQGKAPLNAVEGFIRQIIGWREYVRGIYWLTMPHYLESNELNSKAPLPPLYWGAPTKMHCVSQAIRATREHAHAHHIQRLMITGNLALLLGVDVTEIHRWYLAVYADAYEWVELPNTLGMVMHADGGLLASKPYAASGKYVQRMSDYCGNCHYKVSTADQPDSCPLNALYWHFIDRHRERFESHPRMAMIYRSWGKMDEQRRERIIARGNWLMSNNDSL